MFSSPRLPDRKPLLGIGICYPSPGIVERIGIDWDWLWIDGQHGEFGYQDILALVRACDLIGRPVFIRVASHGYGEIGQALDMGGAGVVVPCVDSVEQARELVLAAKFPPLGNRSYGSRRLVDLHGRMFVEQANAETMLIVQIETPLAISNADAIASLPGVDALFLGPDDVLLRRGLPMNAPRNPETLGPDVRTVVEACRKHGKKAFTIGGSTEMAVFLIQCGYDFIVCGSDVAFLDAGSKNVAANMKNALVGQPPASGPAGAGNKPAGS